MKNHFLKNSINTNPIHDTVFQIATLAANDNHPDTVNATIGSLFGEDGKLFTYSSVFDYYNNMPNITKAKYASSFSGNKSFIDAIDKWILSKTNLNLHHKIIATAGGTGAVSLPFMSVLEEGQTILVPNISWSVYELIASQNNLNFQTYNLFKDGKFDIEDFETKCKEISDTQEKLLVLINDPCHNPTSYSMEIDEWNKVIDVLNECSEKSNVVLLNDIAYIDYSVKENPYEYMNVFNNISENVMVQVAVSLSKSLSSYGLRCGASIILAKNENSVNEVFTVYEKYARSIWSNVANGIMETFAYIANEGYDSYRKELNSNIELLKSRSDIFIKEAENCGLKLYPYREGFFITINVPDKNLDSFHLNLMENHIYAIKVQHGIRVAICSLPVEKVKNLAFRMKEILDQI